MINKPIKILLITNALVLTAAAMLGPLTAIFVDKVGGSIFDASVAGSLFALSAGVITFLSGKYTDIIKNSKLIMVLGYLIMSFGFLLYIFVDSVIFLFITQIIIGFGEAIYSPVFDKLYSQNLTKDHGGSEWGLWESTNYFTEAFGAFIGGLIVVNLGFQALFLIMSLLCFISALYILFFSKRLSN